jgi:hypothetical protein
VGPLLNDLDSSTEIENRIAALVTLLQAAVAVEHRAAANALAAQLASVAHLTGETGLVTFVARHLGDAAALHEDRTVARAYYLKR